MQNKIIVEQPKIVSRIDERFPSIDFKFSNKGCAGSMIYKFQIEVFRATVDRTPVMQYALDVVEKALVLQIVNLGWGPCIKFAAQIDFRNLFADSLKREPKFRWIGDIEETETLKLATIDDFDFADVPETLKLDKDDSRLSISYSDRRYWDAQKYIASNGIASVPVEIQYQDVEGKVYKGGRDGRVIVQCAYRTHIYLSKDGFRRVAFDNGIRACIRSPSCFYHLVLDPLKGEHTRTFNISHVIGSNDFERFFIVIASTISAKFELRFKFYVDSGEVLESQLFSVEIRNLRHSKLKPCTELHEKEGPFSIGPSSSHTTPWW